MNTHDALMVAVWPVVTAVINLVVYLTGQSDKPLAKVIAKLGTVLLSSKV
jgi:hypothetical protein